MHMKNVRIVPRCHWVIVDSLGHHGKQSWRRTRSWQVTYPFYCLCSSSSSPFGRVHFFMASATTITLLVVCAMHRQWEKVDKQKKEKQNRLRESTSISRWPVAANNCKWESALSLSLSLLKCLLFFACSFSCSSILKRTPSQEKQCIRYSHSANTGARLLLVEEVVAACSV